MISNHFSFVFQQQHATNTADGPVRSPRFIHSNEINNPVGGNNSNVLLAAPVATSPRLMTSAVLDDVSVRPRSPRVDMAGSPSCASPIGTSNASPSNFAQATSNASPSTNFAQAPATTSRPAHTVKPSGGSGISSASAMSPVTSSSPQAPATSMSASSPAHAVITAGGSAVGGHAARSDMRAVSPSPIKLTEVTSSVITSSGPAIASPGMLYPSFSSSSLLHHFRSNQSR